MRKVLREWEKARRTDPDPRRQKRALAFRELMRAFLDDQTSKIKSLSPAELAGGDEQETALRRRLLSQLPESFDAGLARRREQGKPGPTSPIVSTCRKLAEDVVLDELRASGFDDIPALFLSALRGGPDGTGGWFDLFVRDAAAKLKQGGEFERIWNAEQVAVMSHMVKGIGAQTNAIATSLPQATNALHEYGTALDALAGDVVATRSYAQAVWNRACGDRALALDFEAVVSTEGLLRFSPRNPRVPFIGRAPEMAVLDDFLGCEQPFAWWLVTGGGGAGKTRLARQLCLRAHLRGWRAGFLPRGFKADMATLDAWQPQHPALIVADYVTERQSEIRTLAARLGRRRDLPPARLLLIERESGERFERPFLGTDMTDRGIIEASRYAGEPLALGGR